MTRSRGLVVSRCPEDWLIRFIYLRNFCASYVFRTFKKIFFSSNAWNYILYTPGVRKMIRSRLILPSCLDAIDWYVQRLIQLEMAAHSPWNILLYSFVRWELDPLQEWQNLKKEKYSSSLLLNKLPKKKTASSWKIKPRLADIQIRYSWKRVWTKLYS